jgi:two-component sensor histidine kinase
VDVRVRRQGDQLELQVRDNGVGLPADTGLNAAKSLGLRIVRLLACRLKATVQIETRGGACFTITFPLSR